MNRRNLLTTAAVSLALIAPVAASPASAGTDGERAAGFNSQFNGSKAGWTNVKGLWTLKPGNLYSKGIAGLRTSVKRTGVYSDFVYSARMKRRGNSTGVAANALVIRGNPTKLDGLGYWKPSYLFQYANQGWYSVWRFNADGSNWPVQGWTATGLVNRTGYNLVDVVVQDSSMWFYLNNTLIWSGSDSGSTFGQVGFSIYTEPGKVSETFIDWASLSTIARLPKAANDARGGVAVKGGTMNMAPQ